MRQDIDGNYLHEDEAGNCACTEDGLKCEPR
jgi:hypothetical protein